MKKENTVSTAATQSTDLQVSPPQPTAANKDFLKQFGGGTLDHLSGADLIIPRYKLVQPTSRTGTPGKWLSSLNPELEMDELNFIILEIRNVQTLFPLAGEGDKPLCRSNDGYRKVDPSMIGDASCASCRYSAWGKDERTGKGIPPRCGSGYNVMGLAVLPDTRMEPSIVTFKRTAMIDARKYWTLMKTMGIPAFSYITVLGSVSELSAKGRYFKPTFRVGAMLSEADVMYAFSQVEMCKSLMSSGNLILDNEAEEHSIPDSGVCGVGGPVQSTPGFTYDPNSVTGEEIPF